MAFRLLLVSVLSSFALIPLTTHHFFASSDGLYHIYRSIEVNRCLESGVLICRWMPDQFLGYGTPLLNLYSPAVYYVITAFHQLGLGWVNATKASMAVFMLFSGIAAYGYASDFLSRRGALLAAVVYVYVPYHLVNAYYRGDLPEFFAMGWFPAILWAFGRIVRPGTTRSRLPYVVAAALCYAGLVLTHNLSAFIYTGILIIYCGFLLLRGVVERQWSLLGAVRPAAMLLGATFLAYALTAYLSFPAMLEKSLIQLEGLLYVSHQDHFPTLKEIMPNRVIHIYGIIFPESPEYAYKMGLVQVLLGGLGALVALIFYKRFPFRARGEAVISVVVFCVSFWFTRPDSLWAWDSIPLLPFAQFPWRFLLLMALPTSVLTGFLVDVLPERWQRIVLPILIVFTLLTNTLGLRPIMANTVEGDIDDADATRFELMYHLLGTTVAGEYVPRWVKDKPFISPEALAIVLGQESPDVHVPTSDRGIQVKRTLKATNEQRFDVNAPSAGRIVLNTVYFPGWRAERERPADRARHHQPGRPDRGPGAGRAEHRPDRLREHAGPDVRRDRLAGRRSPSASGCWRSPGRACPAGVRAPPGRDHPPGRRPIGAAGGDPRPDAVRRLVLRGGVPAAAARPAPAQDQSRRHGDAARVRPAGGRTAAAAPPAGRARDAARALDVLAVDRPRRRAHRAEPAVRAPREHRRAELGLRRRGEPPARSLRTASPSAATPASRSRAACRRASTRSTSASSSAGGRSACATWSWSSCCRPRARSGSGRSR